MININEYKNLKVGDSFTISSPIRIYNLKGVNTLSSGSICEIIEVRHVEQWNNHYINPYVYFMSGIYKGFFQLGSYNSQKCFINLREANLNILLNG